jgi:hypothetical protein
LTWIGGLPLLIVQQKRLIAAFFVDFDFLLAACFDRISHTNVVGS